MKFYKSIFISIAFIYYLIVKSIVCNKVDFNLEFDTRETITSEELLAGNVASTKSIQDDDEEKHKEKNKGDENEVEEREDEERELENVKEHDIEHDKYHHKGHHKVKGDKNEKLENHEDKSEYHENRDHEDNQEHEDNNEKHGNLDKQLKPEYHENKEIKDYHNNQLKPEIYESNENHKEMHKDKEYHEYKEIHDGKEYHNNNENPENKVYNEGKENHENYPEDKENHEEDINTENPVEREKSEFVYEKHGEENEKHGEREWENERENEEKNKQNKLEKGEEQEREEEIEGERRENNEGKEHDLGIINEENIKIPSSYKNMTEPYDKEYEVQSNTGIIHENINGNVQENLQENLQGNIHGNLHGNLHKNMKLKMNSQQTPGYLSEPYPPLPNNKINKIKLIKENRIQHKTSKLETLGGAFGLHDGQFDIPKNQVIFWQGWVRYYHYTMEKKITKPRLFFQNNRFYNQRIPISKRFNKDKLGSKVIPNKAAFFMVVYNNSLSLYSNRDDLLLRAVDSLKIDFINNVPENVPYNGGVKDFGEHKIGSCVEISVRLPKSYHEVFTHDQPNLKSCWIICMDKQIDKAKLISALIKLKVDHQRRAGLISISQNEINRQKSIAEELRKRPPPIDQKDKKIEVPKNGYWILLQDWTDCTLACGGGSSFQQFMCVPPKNGGRPCFGEPIRSKPCNVQKCPDVYSVAKKRNETEIRKPIIRSGRFSHRPQRYSRCQIKEHDAFLATWDPKLRDDNQLPVRIVMNNSTISVYKDDSYEDHYYTYDLKDSVIYSDAKKQCCMYIKDNYKRTKLCGYTQYCSENKWVIDWLSDFNLFKTTCRVGRKKTLLSKEDLKTLEKLKGPEGEGEQFKKMRQKLLEDEGLKFERKIHLNQETGLRAIKKEFAVEDMIMTEEKDRENDELNQIKLKINEEKKKAACLEKQSQEKDLDNSEIDKRDNLKEAELVKKKFALQIEAKRMRMKKFLDNMKKKEKLKKLELENELKEVRSKMAASIIKNNKMGDIRKCITGLTNLDFRDNYCNTNFIEDYIKNTDCKTDEEFCYMCCDNEFGNFYMQKRYKCYDICDAKDKKLKKEHPGNLEGGRWQWAPKFNVKGGESDMENEKQFQQESSRGSDSVSGSESLRRR